MSLNGYLIDTNALSETQKLRPHPSITAFFESVPGSLLHLSVLTLGELRRGSLIKRRRHPGMIDRYALWIDTLERTYSDRILPIDKATATLWGELSTGPTRPAIDSLIAATAIVHDLTLLTRNTRDFGGLPVRLHNPWLA